LARLTERIPDLWRTTVFRLTLIYGAVFVVGVAALLGLIYLQTESVTIHRTDAQIDAGARFLEKSDAEHMPALINAVLARDPRGLNYYGLFSEEGVWITGNFRALPDTIKPDGPPVELDSDGAGGPREVRVRAYRLPWGEILAVGRDIGQFIALRDILLQALLLSGALVIVLGVAGGAALSLAPLRRLGELQAASQVIMRGDLGARLPRSKAHDELDMLAGIVNVMIGEIERLMGEVKGVGDGLAHDLRTPLTRLRALLYRVREQTPADDPHRPMIVQAVAETDALLNRFRALLRISEIERQRRRSGFADIALRPLIEDAAELYAPLAEERAIAMAVTASADPVIEADGELLFEALSNLIDNALKFTPAGGEVRLALTLAAEGPRIEVSDTGPGIPDAEREMVLQRFYRGAAAATTPGSGLGLSIVAAVARLHGYELRLLDARPGLTLRLDCWPH
jgi:signal transduction histidine kinase